MPNLMKLLKAMLALIVFAAFFSHTTAEKIGTFCCFGSPTTSQSDSKAPSTPNQHFDCAHAHSLNLTSTESVAEYPPADQPAEYLSENHPLVEGFTQSIDQPPELS